MNGTSVSNETRLSPISISQRRFGNFPESFGKWKTPRVTFLHEAVFFINRLGSCWPLQWEGCRGEFQKKIFSEAEEIASLNMGLGTNTLPSILGGFIEGISYIARKHLSPLLFSR